MGQIENPSREELFRLKNLERIKRLRLLDDDFFRVCFADDKQGSEFILRILMDKEDLNVIESRTQYSVKNLHGHSVILDVFATDSQGVKYNIEVQRDNSGAIPKRARYNSSLIDSHILISADAYDLLPETYVIFVTEHDAIGEGKPIYHIDRIVAETNKKFGDGSHIIYVNGEYKDDSPLGRLMHDFGCTNPNDMNYSFLMQKTRFFKEDTKGVTHMCRIMEEIREEAIAEERERAREEIERTIAEMKMAMAEMERARTEAEAERTRAAAEAEAERTRAELRELAIKNVLRMLKGGKLTFDEIAEYTSISLEEVKEFAALTSN